jgi:cytoskeleton protein RodZ
VPFETTTSIAKESTNLKPDPNAVARPPGSSVLSFVCQGESWIEVVDGRGKALISRRFNAGESGEAIGRAPFSIVVGNAPQVKMTYNGNEFDLKPHTRIAVARVTVK